MDNISRKIKLWAAATLFAFTIPGCSHVNQKGDRILYLSGDGIYKHFRIMDSDGGNDRMINTGLKDDGCPKWSPDGNKVLFISDNGTEGEYYKYNIYIWDMETFQLSQITFGDNALRGASWSPDGRQIVYASDPSYLERDDLYIMNADGTGVRQITSGETADIDPAWSPDGKYIVYSSAIADPIERRINENYDIFILTLAGGDTKRLGNEAVFDFVYYPPPPRDFGPVWSPNGKKIAFSTSYHYETDTHSNIFIMDSDGKNKMQITYSTDSENDGATWSPDGERIAFSSDGDIYTIDQEGRDRQRLTDRGVDFCPSWEPVPAT
jgi:TolB protein